MYHTRSWSVHHMCRWSVLGQLASMWNAVENVKHLRKIMALFISIEILLALVTFVLTLLPLLFMRLFAVR